MAKIEAYSVLSFDGGVRRDKSFFALKRNELLDGRNIEIDEQGRIRSRRGSHQVGQTLSNNIENSFVWERVVGGSTPVNNIYVNDDASSATVRRLVTTSLTADITTASTTLSITNTSGFSASGTVEIEGDLIAYTGVGAGTLTGVTGIVTNHSAGASVNQWVTLTGGSTLDGRVGIGYAVLNNILFIVGRSATWNQIANDDGVTMTAITGEPAGIFPTNYRDRIYVLGDGSAGTNGDPRRVSFSNRGDGTTWTTGSDFFDVEDQRGEGVTGLRVLNDRLLIFKTNSTFTYDEIELKQRISGVGAWNHKVSVEIDGIIYTFCPRGIFATNGLEAKQIGEPVRQYWENFQPLVDSITNRIVTNTSAGRYKNLYLLYIQDITDPDSINDVTLVYDTKQKTWAVFTGYTDLQHFLGVEKYRWGNRVLQLRPTLFSGAASGRYYRHFETRYTDSSDVKQGGDIFTDLVVDTALTAGTPVSGVIETPLYDLTHPELFKSFGSLRVYAEQGRWNMEYRVQNDQGISAYRPLGSVESYVKVLTFPKETQGYRAGFRITSANTTARSIFNGFIFENTEVIKRK